MSETWPGHQPAEPDPSASAPDAGPDPSASAPAQTDAPARSDASASPASPEPAAIPKPTGHAHPSVPAEPTVDLSVASPEPTVDLSVASPEPTVDLSAASAAPTAAAEWDAAHDLGHDDASAHSDDEAGEPTHDLTETLQDSDDRHHTELRSTRHVTPFVGAASDVGHRHEVNQDAYRVAVVPADGTTTAVLTIADGVSSAIDSDIASDQAAAAATRRVVGHLTETPHNTPQDLAEVLAEAFALANMAVLGGRAAATGPGSCTLIAGVVAADAITVANVGDSRGYWVGDDGTCLRLSIDDSVAQARIDMGVPREQAEAGVHSHAITRWLGPDATDVTPRVLSYVPPTAGWLLVCSDGLWNYASEPDAIAALVRHATQGASAEAASQRLVDWALAQGGRDNVTVALARWEQQA